MSYNQINRLLKKKGWTGEEVGKLLIASMINDIRQQGQEIKEPYISQSDFEIMESSLTSERDHLVYGIYIDLYGAIIDSYNRGQGLYQQFYNGFYRVTSELQEIKHADEAQKRMDYIPLIMTESQYNRLKTEAVKTVGKQKDSFCALIFHCLDVFLTQEEAAIKAEAPAVWEALEAAKKIPAAKHRFLRLCNETFGHGYYSLPDGRRSDQMTSEEWQEALRAEYLKRHKLTARGISQAAEETLERYKKDKFLKSYELFFKGAEAIRAFVLEQTGEPLDGTDEEIENILDKMIELGKTSHSRDAERIAEALDFETPTEWHYYEDPPEGLTLYDLLEMYTEEYRGAFGTDERDALKHFKKDAPALYEALKAYIESKVPQAKGLKANQLYKGIISWEELATTGLIGSKELLEITDEEIVDIATREEDTTENKSKRLRTGIGIAILKHPASYQIDENGDYIEPKNPLHFFRTIYTLGEDESRIAALQSDITELVYPALGYLYAFNALMEIMSKVYDLPELKEVVQFDTTFFEFKMTSFNNILYFLYHDVYGNEAEKQRKRAILKNIFMTMETDSLRPSPEAVGGVTTALTKLGFSGEARKKLKYLDAWIDSLMNMGEGAL